jgi:hypothetical protein
MLAAQLLRQSASATRKLGFHQPAVLLLLLLDRPNYSFCCLVPCC